ncbi:MAG: hypothetical protein JST80_06430 [Bdellovibrionales bacterium]|nr:hypothetical protein [Bdellovibrionales bacterium]
MTDPMQIRLEPVIRDFTTGDYYAEVFKAKQEFFERAGTVYEDDAEFEQRMNLFMDWYLFDRDLPGVDLPPIRYYIRQHQTEFNDEDKGLYQDLASSLHSLFVLHRFTWFKKDLIIVDLFSRKKYTVVDPRLKHAFSKGDVFEGRIFPHGGKWHFAQGFCFHPVEMKSFITSEIKKIRFQDRSRHMKLILQLAQMKLKHHRFAHIDVKHIYEFNSKF